MEAGINMLHIGAGFFFGVLLTMIFLLFRFKVEKAGWIGKCDSLKKDFDRMVMDKTLAEERLQILSREHEKIRKTLSEKEDSIVLINRKLAAGESEVQHLREKLETQKGELESIRSRFTAEFKNLANEILDEKSKKFTEMNQVNIREILDPLRQQIGTFEKQVADAYEKEARERFSLQNEIKHLAELNREISSEARELTEALKNDPKTRGDWGEIVLENILEKSGLVRDREYFVQKTYTDKNGRRFRPDVIIHYPGGKEIVIDSKVSLNAYARYCSLSDETEADKALKEHVRNVKKHIEDLGSKNYQDLPGIERLDFVIMFMPVEPAYLVAIQHDRDIWHYAYERGVLLIGPTNLIAVLKMISNLWNLFHQNRNAAEIARQSGALYDKFVLFINDMQELGKKMNQARDHYDGAMKKLSKGKGNLVRRTELLRELGAKTRKVLDAELLEEACGNEIQEEEVN